MSRQRPIVFSTGSYEYLRRQIVRAGDFVEGKREVEIFPDGERYQRITSKVGGRDVVLVGGTISDSDTLEIFDLACGLVKYGARSLTLVLPFYGFSTMERAVKPGEVVTAKTRARLLSAIPLASEGNRIFLLDLHSEGIPYYFEGGVTTRHIYAKPVIIKAVKKIAGADDFVLASTDAGRAKWVESLANDIGCPAAFALKRRLSGKKTELVGVSGSVEGKLVIIYDDMIRTGGSLIEAAGGYKKAGAKAIAVVSTHGLFPGNAVERLRGSGLIRRIVCTDSHPRAVALRDGFVGVESIAGLMARELKSR